MNFWQIFIRVFWWRPLPALGALWWQLTRRKVRARNRLRAAGAPLPFAYKFWMRNVEQPEQRIELATEARLTWATKPSFTVVVDASRCDDAEIADSLSAIERQLHAAGQVIVIGGAREIGGSFEGADSPKAALAASASDFIVPVAGGDQLSSWALFHFADALQGTPDALILYGDEDELDGEGARRRPWFKSAWNEELFLARDYISRGCALRSDSARGLINDNLPANETWTFDLLLRMVAAHDGPVVHIPKIVTHVRNIDAQADQRARVAVVAEHAALRGGSAGPAAFDSVKVSWPLPQCLPLVSIIIPTRDKLDLLRPCVDSILERTTYAPLEILVIDNGSVQPETLRYFEELASEPRVRVLPYPHAYNYSAINNHAARQARGSYLCLLNNDTEVVGGDWLTEMMRYGVRPDIGAVGAKLLYADGRIQHAGVIVGIGDAAGHAHRNLPGDDAGYFGRAHLTQFVSAVTGACLLVDTRKFLAVGGLDEQHLPIAYNDVDLCLKLERAGWRNVYVPHAVLTHHESKSRANDHAPARIAAYRRELAAFQERWGAKDYKDPLLNPNLDRSSETFLIRF